MSSSSASRLPSTESWNDRLRSEFDPILTTLVIWRAREPSSAGWAAIVAAYLAALFILVRALGEATAEPSADTSKAVMVCSAIVWTGIAAVLAGVASAAAKERR